MTTEERSKWYFLTGLRALLSLLDLVGILAIGFVVTSTAIFLTEGSNPNRVLDVAGLQIPAVNAQTLPWVAGLVLALFLFKALFSILLLRKAAYFVAKIEARAARTIAEIALGGDLGSARERSREDVMFAVHHTFFCNESIQENKRVVSPNSILVSSIQYSFILCYPLQNYLLDISAPSNSIPNSFVKVIQYSVGYHLCNSNDSCNC